MTAGPIIDVKDVWKTFQRHPGRLILRSHIRRAMADRLRWEPFCALKNISFRVEPGESVGIVGANGAGKSTLLGLVAGLVPPDRGTLALNGRVAALLELGSGFHPDLTGAEYSHRTTDKIKTHKAIELEITFARAIERPRNFAIERK